VPQTLPAAPAGRKPASEPTRTDQAKPRRKAGPWTRAQEAPSERARMIALANSIARSDMMTDAAALVKALADLREMARDFVDTHSSTSLVIAVNEAGHRPVNDDYLVELASGLLHDVEGLLYNLGAAEAFISSQVVPETPEEESGVRGAK
jgi:hypothetical protein